jgi:hypothetical protein
MAAYSNHKPADSKALSARSTNAALESHPLALVRGALVDWAVNVLGQEASVPLTVEIEQLQTRAQLSTMLTRLCREFVGVATSGNIERNRAFITRLLEADSTASR